MNTETKKQHYVWRKYLNPWKLSPEERKVWTYIIKTNNGWHGDRRMTLRWMMEEG